MLYKTNDPIRFLKTILSACKHNVKVSEKIFMHYLSNIAGLIICKTSTFFSFNPFNGTPVNLHFCKYIFCLMWSHKKKSCDVKSGGLAGH